MADIIKMNVPLMEEMAQMFRQASDTLDTTLSEVGSIAQLLADGALLGQGGDNFEQSCRVTLTQTIQQFQAKINELEQDIRANIEIFQSTDKTVQSFVG